MKLEKYEEARSMYDWAIKLDPQMAYNYILKGIFFNLLLGDLLMKLEKYEEAISMYD